MHKDLAHKGGSNLRMEDTEPQDMIQEVEQAVSIQLFDSTGVQGNVTQNNLRLSVAQ